MSSKPTTATCSGTRTPALAKACSTPMAIWSFAHTTASGSESPRAASSFSPASSPLPTLNRPSYLPTSWQPGWAPSSSCSARRRSLASGAVVRGHHIGRPLAGVPGDDHHGQPLGQPRQERGRHHALTDQQAVDLAGQREQPGQVRVAGLLEVGDQQGPLVVPDARLDAAQYLVVEQQAHALDGVLLPWRLALHADQADHVLAAP